MFPTQTLLFSYLLFSLSVVDASPFARHAGKATLRFATSSRATSFTNLAEHDRARARAMQQASPLEKRTTGISFSVTDATRFYTTQVDIGSPPTSYTLVVDTGSSSTWVGANKPYVPTSSSFDTGNSVSFTYGSGSYYGEEWTDTVTLAPGLTIPNQSIGVAANTTGFSGLGIDGILGVGPLNLTRGLVNNTYEVPTVTDNLYTQGTISKEVLGIYFVPTAEPDNNGELTFGGYDDSVTTSDVNYVPLTHTWPASTFWGVDQSISYGDSPILNLTAGIVDTGTTFILIASDAFQRYQSMTGGIMDNTTGLLTITPAQYANLKSLTYHIGSHSYDLVPNAQIWPRSLNTVMGGSADLIYLVFVDIGYPSGAGLDFVNGLCFLERFYSVFDTDCQAVGLAETKYTHAQIN